MASPPLLSAAVLDLNAHILPGIHAATPDLAASVDACRMLADAGVMAAVAPALIRSSPDDDLLAADAARASLQVALAEGTVPLDLLPGAVIPFDALLQIDPEALAASTVGGGGRWLMVTLPDAGWPLALPEALRSLEAAGMGMVIAHPERSASVQASPDRLRDAIGRGALVQLAAGSMSGAHGARAERTAFDLLRNGMVTVVASDEPSAVDHTLALDQAVASLEGVLRRPRDEVMWMLDAGPQRIAAGDPVRAPRLVPLPRGA